jgi:hypothetical protein
MIEDQIGKLARGQPDHPLDRLEADIWAGVAVRLKAQQVSRKVLTFQMAAMAVALVLVIVAGSQAGRSLVTGGSAPDPFASEMELAPSTLLLGPRA